jgi:ankyrin repeat protein
LLLLIMAAADGVLETQGKRTALHCAADNGRLEAAQVLVARGADVNAVDEVSEQHARWNVWEDGVVLAC